MSEISEDSEPEVITFENAKRNVKGQISKVDKKIKKKKRNNKDTIPKELQAIINQKLDEKALKNLRDIKILKENKEIIKAPIEIQKSKNFLNIAICA